MNRPRAGFSLVELSIVLVILGLLVGGILAGQSLIRAAEMRNVGTEYNRYITAVSAFRDKYFAIPGDFHSATSIWPQSTVCGGATAGGVCNGDGDGTINTGSIEPFQFWTQLADAGLVEGSYSGTSGPGGVNESVIGTNCPGSKLSTAGWTPETKGSYTGVSVRYTGSYGNDFSFGAFKTGSATDYPSILLPEEAWNIDTKLDDGYPGTGKIFVRSYGSWGASSCSTSTSDTDYTGVYNVSYKQRQCSLYFLRAF